MSASSLPLQMYDFGTLGRWQNVARKAIAEGILEKVGVISTASTAEGSVVYTANVLGHSGVSWYAIRLERSAEALLVGCACTAGQHAKPCKHIAALMIVKGWIRVPEELRQVALVAPEPEDAATVEFVRRIR